MASFSQDDRPPQNPAACQDENVHLRRALGTQPVIDQAKGMLMAQHGCTSDEAFAMLAQASQRDNRKLSVIAQDMITGVAGSRSERAGQGPGGAPARNPEPRDAAADLRDIAADAREKAADDRDRIADQRDTETQLREAVAAEEQAQVDAVIAGALLRDQLAERRDRQADVRDRAAERRPAGSYEDSVGASWDRGRAQMERSLSGEERDLSAGDAADLRALWRRAGISRAADADACDEAAIDRLRSAVDRLEADLARDATELDRTAAAADRATDA
jgi:hypothetical protein